MFGLLKKLPDWAGVVVAVGVLLGAIGASYRAQAVVFDHFAAKSEVVSRISDDLTRHKMEQRAAYLEERMWAAEERWRERFIEEKGEAPDSLEEIIAYMTAEAREQYRRWEKEYERLMDELYPDEEEE